MYNFVRDVYYCSGALLATLRSLFLELGVFDLRFDPAYYVDSDFSSFTPPIVENEGRTTWDARLGYRITSRITGVLAIDNLTGLDYQEPLGYQALQRAVRAGVRIGL